MTLRLPDPKVDNGDWAGERTGVQRNLDHIARQFPVAARNLANDVLLLAVPGTGRKVAFGSSSATWTAAVLSGAVTIAHGLGVAPGYVGAQTQAQLFDFKVTADATNLTITGFRTDNTAVSSTVNFYWVAIG